MMTETQLTIARRTFLTKTRLTKIYMHINSFFWRLAKNWSFITVKHAVSIFVFMIAEDVLPICSSATELPKLNCYDLMKHLRSLFKNSNNIF